MIYTINSEGFFWEGGGGFVTIINFTNLILIGLGGFEITVEHESATGLTTEVESKWSQVKNEPSEQKYVLRDE